MNENNTICSGGDTNGDRTYSAKIILKRLCINTSFKQPERKIPLARQKSRWKDNIKIDLRITNVWLSAAARGWLV
jgi:hypothetical protein